MPKPSKDRLIEGTIRSIAKHGIEGTTVTNIVAEAGLTRAMVMKAFGNKETLLQATAERFGESYFREISKLMADADPSPSEFVRAMVRADLSPEVLNAETITVLMVLRSLAHSDPKIREFSSTRDRRLRDAYTDAIGNALAKPDPEGALAKDLATATIAMLEGFWADYFLFMGKFDREKAESLVMMLLEPYLQSSRETN
jgi:AcrR family transcriptional regulator